MRGEGLTFPDEMGHFWGELQGQLYQAGWFAVFQPGGLVDKFFDAVLFYGVGVGAGLGQHFFQLGFGRFGVAVQQVGSQQVFAPAFGEGGGGSAVHLYYLPGLIADSDGEVHAVFPVFHDYLRTRAVPLNAG